MFAPTNFIRASIPLLYGVALVLLVAVLIPGIGVKIHGQRCWIALGGFQFQPSEFGKLATLLMVGFFVAQRGRAFGGMRDMLKVIGIIIVPMGLVLLEKDAGTASVYAAMLLGVLLWAGVRLLIVFLLVLVPISAVTAMHAVMYNTFLALGAVALVAAAISFALERRWWAPVATLVLVAVTSYASSVAFEHLPEYQRGRIRTFFEPEKYPKEEGYHVLQSLIAIGSGGVTGKGTCMVHKRSSATSPSSGPILSSVCRRKSSGLLVQRLSLGSTAFCLFGWSGSTARPATQLPRC